MNTQAPNHHQIADLEPADARALFDAMRGYREQHPHATATRLLHHLLPPPPADLLEVGPGNGEDAAALATAGYRVTGVDLRDDLTTPDGWELRVGTATALPAADATADAILANRVIHHVPDLAAFWAETTRVLRPGGLVAVSWPDWNARTSPTPGVTRALAESLPYTHQRVAGARSLADVTESLTDAGLNVEVTAQVWETVRGTDILGYGAGRPLREESLHAYPDRLADILGRFADEARAGRGEVTYNLTVVSARRP